MKTFQNFKHTPFTTSAIRVFNSSKSKTLKEFQDLLWIHSNLYNKYNFFIIMILTNQREYHSAALVGRVTSSLGIGFLHFLSSFFNVLLDFGFASLSLLFFHFAFTHLKATVDKNIKNWSTVYGKGY